MARPKLGWLCSAAGLVLLIAGVIHAAVTTIPDTLLNPFSRYYTDAIGGGIGTPVTFSGGETRNDDDISLAKSLGFNLTFFGNTYSQFFINNNGNISFGTGISDYTPTGPQGAAQPIISPYFADVDTRNASSGLVYLRTDIANEIIVTWDQVGYFGSHADKLDSFQLVLRGPGYTVPSGEGQIGFFYKAMQWETGDSSGGSGGFGGTPAAVGFGDGNSNGSVLQGSIQNGISAIVNNKMIWFNLTSGGVTAVGAPASAAVGTPAASWWSLAMLGLGILGIGQYLLSRRASGGARS
jgi:hypothetical protein